MECKFCKNKMRLDDVDFTFKGNKDNYYICDKCGATACEMIRYGKSIKIEWDKSETY